MTTRSPAQCLSCVHLFADESTVGLPPVERCAAFPAGIPTDIRHGADHRQPRGGELAALTHQLAAGKDGLFDSWRRTFAPTDAELSRDRLTMDQPVTFTRPPDAMVE